VPYRDPEKKRAAQRRWKQKKYREDPAAFRAARRRELLRARYKITPEQWDEMLIEQTGRCAICGDEMKDPHVDHDHTSGAVRGLLCNLCNSVLGKARENTAILAAAIEYLDRHHPERTIL
jgi:hypothetical protein